MEAESSRSAASKANSRSSSESSSSSAEWFASASALPPVGRAGADSGFEAVAPSVSNVAMAAHSRQPLGRFDDCVENETAAAHAQHAAL